MMSTRSAQVCLILFLAVVISMTGTQSIRGYEMEPVKINDLINKAKDMDGQIVKIRGEVIGDIMGRKDMVWFNVQDDTNVMGVWSSGRLTEKILVAGDYNYKGDIVEILGKFSRADNEFGGEICIRAQAVDVLERGYKVDHVPGPVKVKVALFLSMLCAVLLMLKMTIQRRN